MYFPNVRQPETVRFPGWAWQLGACPWYTGEQGPEKLCHGDSVNQAPMPCPVTGDTWEPCQDAPETVSTPSTSHSPHTGPQPVQGPGGSTRGTHCATRTAAGCTGQQDRAGKEGRPGAEAGAQRAGQVRGGRHVDSAPAIRGSARSRPRARMGCGRGRNKAGDIDGAERKGRVKPCSETGHSPEAWRATENEALEGGGWRAFRLLSGCRLGGPGW